MLHRASFPCHTTYVSLLRELRNDTPIPDIIQQDAPSRDPFTFKHILLLTIITLSNLRVLQRQNLLSKALVKIAKLEKQ